MTDEEIADELSTLLCLFGVKGGHAYIKSPGSDRRGRPLSRANMKYRIYWMRPVYHKHDQPGAWIPDWMATEREGKFVQVYKKYTGWVYFDQKFKCNSVEAWRRKAHQIIEECRDDPVVEYFE